MTNIHLIGGEKGGVGKSVVARLLAQYFIDHSIPFLGFDSDRSHGALLRFYAGYASAVVIDRYESLDAIVEAAAEQPERRVLVDLAAQTQEPLTKWMDESQLLEVAPEIGLRMRYWHVMDSGKDDILKGSGLLERAQALGAQAIVIKRLQEAAMTKIDGSSSSFWAATQKGDAGATQLGILERQRVRTWLTSAYEAIRAVDP